MDDQVVCPKCMGIGIIDCYCGGDLCVCQNYGEAECPMCFGDGEVTPETSDAFFERQRKFYEGFKPLSEEDA